MAGTIVVACGVLLALFSIVWLHIRGFRDGAFFDPIMFMTGVALVAYIVGRWDRAQHPIYVMLIGLGLAFCGPVLWSINS